MDIYGRQRNLAMFPIEAPKPVSYSDFLVERRSGKLNDLQVTERELIAGRKPAAAGLLWPAAVEAPDTLEALLREIEVPLFAARRRFRARGDPSVTPAVGRAAQVRWCEIAQIDLQ